MNLFSVMSEKGREKFCRMNSMLVCAQISFRWGGTYLVSGGALAGPGYDPDVIQAFHLSECERAV